MKKTLALILAAVLVIALLGLYGCHPAAPQATEPTAATEAIETTAVTEATEATAAMAPAETEAPTEAPTEESTVPEETDAPTLPAEVNRPQGGSTGSSNDQQTGNTGTGGSKPSGSTGSGSGTQQPPVTPPPATQPPVTVPPATQPPVTEPPATEHTHYYVITSTIPATCTQDGSVTYTCDVCWDSYTEVIPAAHVWVHHHEDEVGHEVGGCICRCGAIFSTTAEWIAHRDSFDLGEAFLNHGGNASYSEWIVDTPAKDWDECSVCGAIK